MRQRIGIMIENLGLALLRLSDRLRGIPDIPVDTGELKRVPYVSTRFVSGREGVLPDLADFEVRPVKIVAPSVKL